MISFRYHLVSVAAVLLSLAAGVALGSGLLSDSVATTSGDDDVTTDEGLVAFEDGYAARTSTSLVEGTLDDRSVVVLTLPGARAEEVDGLVRDLDRAGATVTGRGGLTSRLVDPANRQFAESVAQESATDVDAVGAAGDAYGRIGAALGRGVLGDDERDDQARTITAAFVEGDLLTWEDEPTVAADLALVVAGPGRAGDAGQSVGTLLTAVGDAGTAALLAGPSASSQDGGLVAAVRDDDAATSVSTVDVTDTAAGRAVTVLALEQAAGDQPGAWGTSRSADGALPD